MFVYGFSLVEVISKFALAEFEFGSADRARMLFEELLGNYPKRVDLWHLYVDKEVKLGNIFEARKLFDRMASLRQSSDRNMKTIFKKYLEFEMKYGTIESQQAVKEKAMEYAKQLEKKWND